MKVKICGITDVQTALSAVDFGADAIGFVFAESKRKIDLDHAKEIVSKLPRDTMKVGVFVDETKEGLERIASFVGLTHLQLHGNETPEFCRSLSFPVIKAISVQDTSSLNNMRNFPCEFILVDGPKGKYHGGNGLAFDWSILKEQDFINKKVILAGGLHEGNVLEAIKQGNPYMVDVSSGVETEGKKDLQKIKSFIDMVKGSLTGRNIQ